MDVKNMATIIPIRPVRTTFEMLQTTETCMIAGGDLGTSTIVIELHDRGGWSRKFYNTEL